MCIRDRGGGDTLGKSLRQRAARVVLVQFVSLFINCILICFAIQGTCINSIGFVRDTLNFRPKAALAVCNSIGILAIVAVV